MATGLYIRRYQPDDLDAVVDLWYRSWSTALLAQARAASPGGLSLHALQANVAARAFYERHGFTVGETGINRINGQPNVEYRWTPARHR
jgi:hypothetical protein